MVFYEIENSTDAHVIVSREIDEGGTPRHWVTKANSAAIALLEIPMSSLSGNRDSRIEIHELVPPPIRDRHREYVERIFMKPEWRSMRDPKGRIKGWKFASKESFPAFVEFMPQVEDGKSCEAIASKIVPRPVQKVPLHVAALQPRNLVVAGAIGIAVLLIAKGEIDKALGLLGTGGGSRIGFAMGAKKPEEEAE